MQLQRQQQAAAVCSQQQQQQAASAQQQASSASQGSRCSDRASRCILEAVIPEKPFNCRIAELLRVRIVFSFCKQILLPALIHIAATHAGNTQQLWSWMYSNFTIHKYPCIFNSCWLMDVCMACVQLTEERRNGQIACTYFLDMSWAKWRKKLQSLLGY